MSCFKDIPGASEHFFQSNDIATGALTTLKIPFTYINRCVRLRFRSNLTCTDL